jgi:hypothetical protein
VKQVALFLCLTSIIPTLAAGQDRDQRIADLERQLAEAKGSVAAIQRTIESLSKDMQALRQGDARSAVITAAAVPVAAPPASAPSEQGGGTQTDV